MSQNSECSLIVNARRNKANYLDMIKEMDEVISEFGKYRIKYIGSGCERFAKTIELAKARKLKLKEEYERLVEPEVNNELDTGNRRNLDFAW